MTTAIIEPILPEQVGEPTLYDFCFLAAFFSRTAPSNSETSCPKISSSFNL